MDVDNKEEIGEYGKAATVDGDEKAFHGNLFGDFRFKESSLLNEFTWNHPPEFGPYDGWFIDLNPFSSDLFSIASRDDITSSFRNFIDAPAPAPTASNCSTPCSSSEDPPGNSTASTNAVNPQSIVAKKTKRKMQKRIKEPRFSFVTESEVEQLEDGYRWRKYGQKPVKNSPHPRSYFRCTNNNCFVKKMIERSREDPSFVVTTYEGKHTHHSYTYTVDDRVFLVHEHSPTSNLLPSSASSSLSGRPPNHRTASSSDCRGSILPDNLLHRTRG